MKKCNKCKENKELLKFDKDKNKKDGLQSQCKLCLNKWRKDNKEKVNKNQKKYRENNKIKESKRKKKWYQNNKEKCSKTCKKWRLNNKDKTKVRMQKYYLKNKEKLNASNSNYKKNNKESINQYYKERLKNDPSFKIAHNLRVRMKDIFKNNFKSGSAVKDLGCSIKDLKIHLEQQFQEGMNWDNYGSWHIDHIKPLASFDLAKREQLLEACNYNNLQPLWAKDNLSKGCRV